MKDIQTKHILETDISRLAECERNFATRIKSFPDDSPTGKPRTMRAVQPWAWDEKAIIEATAQYRNKALGTYDTRAYVAQIPIPSEDPRTGKTHEVSKTVGGLICQKLDSSYEILLLTVNSGLLPIKQEGDMPGQYDILDCLLDRVIRKAENSEKQTKVEFYVPDGHYELLKFLISRKWTRKLIRSYFADGNDAWLCEWETEDQEAESQEQTQSA